jgi:hypothetical protein
VFAGIILYVYLVGLAALIFHLSSIGKYTLLPFGCACSTRRFVA